MRPMRWLAGLATCATIAVAGCSPFGGGSFACADNTECSNNASAGFCESTGFCSFADSDCTSGRRYGDLAGNGLAGVCVGEEPNDFDAAPMADADPNAPDADPNAPDADPNMPDADLGDFCDPQAGLVACYQFENNVNDLTGDNDLTATNETYEAGVDGLALSHAANTTVSLPDDADFDVAAFTVELWVRPGQLPNSGARMGLLDNNGQYGLFLRPGGVVSCSGGNNIQSTAALSVGQFGHVACTADGASVTIYVNGVELSGAGAALGTTVNPVRVGSDSPNGGDELVGRIDNLRFWNVVRTRAQICADNPGACP